MSQPLPIIQGRNTMPRKTNRCTKPHRRHRPRNQAAGHQYRASRPYVSGPRHDLARQMKADQDEALNKVMPQVAGTATHELKGAGQETMAPKRKQLSPELASTFLMGMVLALQDSSRPDHE